MLPETAYKSLLDNIGQTFTAARARAYAAVNQQLLEAYWNIGRYIVEYEQQGHGKAVYGKQLMQQLSKDLTLRLGKGFSKTHLYQMRQFYELYPIFQSVTGKLTWTHFGELVSISDPLARSFYEKQCVNEGWSVRQLKRQIQSGLFQRLALSKDKEGVLALATEGHSPNPRWREAPPRDNYPQGSALNDITTKQGKALTIHDARHSLAPAI